MFMGGFLFLSKMYRRQERIDRETADEYPQVGFAARFFAQEKASGSAWPKEFSKDLIKLSKKNEALD
jgi:hypothetical protein